MNIDQAKGLDVEYRLMDKLDKKLFDAVFDPYLEDLRKRRDGQCLEKKRLLRHVADACEYAINCIDKRMDDEGVKDKMSFKLRCQRAPKALEMAIKVLMDKVYRAEDWQTKCLKDLASANRFKAGLAALIARVGSGQAALSKEELDRFVEGEAIAFFLKVSQSLTNTANAKSGKAKAQSAKATKASPLTKKATPSAKEPALAAQAKVSQVPQDAAQATASVTNQRGA